jgi:hypothetical protein
MHWMIHKFMLICVSLLDDANKSKANHLLKDLDELAKAIG